ncbi:hypothetical protein IJ843_08125 [bacterium]|nr:hypothetical protein [bacterium]
MQKIFDKTKFVDICDYHNQTIDFLEEIKKQTDYFPKKLINFDMHSDIRCNYEEEFICVYNWVNFAFKNYGISEYYCVFPKSVFKNEDFVNCLFGDVANLSKGRAFYGNYTKKEYKYSDNSPLIQNLIFDKEKNQFLTEYSCLSEEDFLQKVLENKNYTQVKVYFCTENNIPDFKDEDVIVSVDGDYFANNGYDTFEDFSYNPENIENDFTKFLNCLKEKHIKPLFLSLCISPNYSLKTNEISDFFAQIKNNCTNSNNLNFEHIHTDVRYDDYDYCVVFFDKTGSEYSFFDVSNNGREIDKNFALNILKEKYNDMEDGTYLFSFYVKDCTNPKTGKTYIKLYPDEYFIDTYTKS